MANAAIIHSELRRVARGELAIQDFESWLAEETWSVPPGDPLRALTDPVTGTLVEFSAGAIDEAHARAELAALAGISDLSQTTR